MLIDDYLENATEINHNKYRNSIFWTTAPEYSTGEIFLGSIYRAFFYNNKNLGVDLEKTVDLGKLISLPGKFPSDIGGERLWSSLIGISGIGSPSPKRSAIRKQLMPLVPEIAKHACVLGKPRGRWKPSSLFFEVIGAGLSPIEGNLLIQELGYALEVTPKDDIFSRFIENSLRRIDGYTPSPPPYKEIKLGRDQCFAYRGHSEGETNYPAARFCRDLEVIISQKYRLTRRQWTVLLEATLRLGMGLHFLWIAQINILIWHWILLAADGKTPISDEEIDSFIWHSHPEKSPLLQISSPARPMYEQLLREYAEARFGINTVLFALEDRSVGLIDPLGYSEDDGISTSKKIKDFLVHISQNRLSIDSNPGSWLRGKCSELVNKHQDLLKMNSGFTRNMKFFIRYGLGQIDTPDPEQSSYDQAYLFRNRSSAKRETEHSLIVHPGPAMLIALVNACCHEKGKRLASLEDLRMHFADYGLHVPAGELYGGQVGMDLQKLGLVVDSPDASGGRLLVPPFNI